MALKRKLGLAGAALAGCTLASLSGISLAASWIAVPSETALEALRNRQSVPARDAIDAAQRNFRAGLWFEQARYFTNTALALSALPDDYPKANALPAVGTVLRAALMRHPGSPYNWTRLSVHNLQNNDVEGAREAWTAAVLTGRYVPALLETRVDIGLRLLPGLDREQTDLLVSQLRLLIAFDPKAAVRVAQSRRAMPLARAITSTDPVLTSRLSLAERLLRAEAIQ